MKYAAHSVKKSRHLRWKIIRLLCAVTIVFIIAASISIVVYRRDLNPVSNTGQTQTVVITSGTTLDTIAGQLQNAGLIRSKWAFQLYVTLRHARSSLQAGTYAVSPSQSTPEIVTLLTHGAVIVKTVTILPGQRLDQIRTSLLDAGFTPADVNMALDPNTYAGSSLLSDKPPGVSLEGYLYPDTFQRAANTTAVIVVGQSLAEMQKHLTPDIRDGFARHGLSLYQGIILASIVSQEAAKQSDRNQVAQVFLTRLSQGGKLGSDVTAYYGAIIAGQPHILTYDSPYNTLIHTGLPPTPISNVTDSSLQAVAHPATTNWLYFVAGDDGTTYFSMTYAEQQANAQKYCHKLCNN